MLDAVTKLLYIRQICTKHARGDGGEEKEEEDSSGCEYKSL